MAKPLIRCPIELPLDQGEQLYRPVATRVTSQPRRRGTVLYSQCPIDFGHLDKLSHGLGLSTVVAVDAGAGPTSGRRSCPPAPPFDIAGVPTM
jgi:hypothetical protein